MKNKKIILFCATFIACASLVTYLKTKNDLPDYPIEPEPTPAETKAARPATTSLPTPPAPTIPHFVAGRTSLVKKAQAIYGKADENQDSMRQPSSGKKSQRRQPPSTQSFTIKNAGVSFALDLYACLEADCPKAKPLLMTSGFYIIKGVPPKKIDKSSSSLVTYNKETNQFGIWEKRVIVELKEVVDMNEELRELKFSSIENPQPMLFIAEYNGDTAQLDSTLAQIKQNQNVKDVRLEVTYSKDRPN